MLDELIENRIRKKKKENEIHSVIRISVYIAIIATIILIIMLVFTLGSSGHCLTKENIAKARSLFNNNEITQEELDEILYDYNNNKCNLRSELLEKVI